MDHWSERQKLLREYEENNSKGPDPQRSLEETCRLLDEMRNISEQLGTTLPKNWFERHLPLHHTIQSAMKAVHKARKRA
jgi:hypothetical protein